MQPATTTTAVVVYSTSRSDWCRPPLVAEVLCQDPSVTPRTLKPPTCLHKSGEDIQDQVSEMVGRGPFSTTLVSVGPAPGFRVLSTRNHWVYLTTQGNYCLRLLLEFL